MRMKVVLLKKLTGILFSILVSIFIFSCSVSSTETSIHTSFLEIDSLIEIQEFDTAWKLLKKTSKKNNKSS